MKKRIIITLALILILTIGTLAYSRLIANRWVRVKTTHLTSEKIDPTFDGFSIVFFSDVHYGEFVDENRFESIIHKINSLNPDVILFGGNLVTSFESEEEQTLFLEHLRELKAPYGKFAVMGELEENSSAIANVVSFFNQADFEVLSNQSAKLYYETTNSYLNLIGLQKGESEPFEIDQSQYTIAFGHYPSLFNKVERLTPELFIAGHTHGGQINVPFFSDAFYKGEVIPQSNDTLIQISNGVGTTQTDMRLFAPAQINQYIIVLE